MYLVSESNNYFLMIANLLVKDKSGHIAAEGIQDHSVTDKYLVNTCIIEEQKPVVTLAVSASLKLRKIPEHTCHLLLNCCSGWSTNF